MINNSIGKFGVGVITMTKENVRSNVCVSQNEYSVDNILPIHLGFYNLKLPLDYLRIKSRKPQFNKILHYSNEIWITLSYKKFTILFELYCLTKKIIILWLLITFKKKMKTNLVRRNVLAKDVCEHYKQLPENVIHALWLPSWSFGCIGLWSNVKFSPG